MKNIFILSIFVITNIAFANNSVEKIELPRLCVTFPKASLTDGLQYCRDAAIAASTLKSDSYRISTTCEYTGTAQCDDPGSFLYKTTLFITDKTMPSHAANGTIGNNWSAIFASDNAVNFFHVLFSKQDRFLIDDVGGT